jgi:hypothetical protein
MLLLPVCHYVPSFFPEATGFRAFYVENRNPVPYIPFYKGEDVAQKRATKKTGDYPSPVK